MQAPCSVECQADASSPCACALQGQTALHWAARRGYASVVRELIAQGADVNAADGQVCDLLIKCVICWTAPCSDCPLSWSVSER